MIARTAFRPVFFVSATLVLGLAGFAAAQPYRTIDGTGNNIANPDWGSAGAPLVRVALSDYGDGQSTPAGASRPSARAVSNGVASQTDLRDNQAHATGFLWQWGQFLDHDIDLTEVHDRDADPAEIFDIPVPPGDPWFDPQNTGNVVIPLTRSLDVLGLSPRQQPNNITAFIDASNVYGSDAARAAELRTLDGTGKLKTSPGDLLPFNVNGFPNAQPGGLPADMFFLAGDVRANEQVGLTAMHTLFVREHNRLADEIALANPQLTGEEIYQEARKIVGAQMQVITYNEFVPLLLGPGALPPYAGYQNTVNPGIVNEFSTAAYRVGHTMLPSRLLRLAESGSPVSFGHLPLRDGFFDPTRITDEGGIEPLLRGLCALASQEIDHLVIDDVRNFLFGPPGAGGFDLASLNIQRGRDHGLPGYNEMRVAYGLPAVTTFFEINPDAQVQQRLSTTYGSVDDIDAWVGGLAESHVPGALVGELFFEMMRHQFEALRDGDRYFYLNGQFSPAELAELETTRLADIIRRNTDIVAIPDNVFQMVDFSRGDCNLDGIFDLGDSVFLANYIFLDGDPIGCADGCDSNDDGQLDVSDIIWNILHLFAGAPPPAQPFPGCGADLTSDLLGCYRSVGCP